MTARFIVIIALALLAVAVVASTFFRVFEYEQAIVLRFGEPIKTITEPGLNWKTPFIDDVQMLDRRVLNLDVPPEEVIASDQKRLMVDAYARFRIVDPLLVYQSVNNENGARERLVPIIKGNLRNVLGSQAFKTLLSAERAALMAQIRDGANRTAKDIGIEIIDVRITRADLPVANSASIFERMKSERVREANELRARGAEEALRIRAEAERERTILVAEAQRQAQVLRGEGDAEAVKIFAAAFGRDEEFFAFYRSMEAYRQALGNADTTLVLSPDSEFFKYFDALKPAERR
ncbi:MAG: protease modulator HflC [Pseudomonadota bacterium]